MPSGYYVLPKKNNPNQIKFSLGTNVTPVMSAEIEYWKLSLTAPKSDIELFQYVVGDSYESISLFEKINDNCPPVGHIEVIFRRKPSLVEIVTRCAVVAAANGMGEPGVELERFTPKNWLLENIRKFEPINVGRFFIHGDHYRGAFPYGRVPIVINAATAFGTGEHESTQGCLEELHELEKKCFFRSILAQCGQYPVLDMGCGTGILGLAAGKVWKVGVVAVDSDLEATRVASKMAAMNGFLPRLRILQSDGPVQREIIRTAPFGIILANIYSRPLVSMASSFANLLVSGGRVVLAGFLERHIPLVLGAYRQQGFRLERKRLIGHWATLVLRR